MRKVSLGLIAATAAVALFFNNLGPTAQILSATLLLLISSALILKGRYEKPLLPRLGGVLIGVGTLLLGGGMLVSEMVPSQEFGFGFAFLFICCAIAGPIVQLTAQNKKTADQINEVLQAVDGLQENLDSVSAEKEKETDRADKAESTLEKRKKELKREKKRANKAEKALSGFKETAKTAEDRAYEAEANASSLQEQLGQERAALAKARVGANASSAQIASELADAGTSSAQTAVANQVVRVSEARSDLEYARKMLSEAQKAHEDAVAHAELAWQKVESANILSEAESLSFIKEGARYADEQVGFRFACLQVAEKDAASADEALVAARARLQILQHDLTKATAVAEDAEVDLLAAQRQQEHLIDMEAEIVDVSDALAKEQDINEEMSQRVGDLEDSLRVAKESGRVVSLVPVYTYEGITWHRVTIAVAQEETLFVGVGIKNAELNKAACRRILPGELESSDSLVGITHGNETDVRILAPDAFTISEKTREGMDIPDGDIPVYYPDPAILRVA